MNSHGILIKPTSDGSCTLFDSALNETYHSLHGALSESLHVYIHNGLTKAIHPQTSSLNILEIGFGTGMNLLLTLQNRPNGLNVNYLSLEPFPLDAGLLEQYYRGFPKPVHGAERLLEISRLPADSWHNIDEGFSFQCLKVKLQDLNSIQNISDWKADLVYYDAFAPSRQPELWTHDVLSIVSEKMNPGALLTTYCAQGQFKRYLKELGLIIENPKGANGKREMTIATKP